MVSQFFILVLQKTPGRRGWFGKMASVLSSPAVEAILIEKSVCTLTLGLNAYMDQRRRHGLINAAMHWAPISWRVVCQERRNMSIRSSFLIDLWTLRWELRWVVDSQWCTKFSDIFWLLIGGLTSDIGSGLGWFFTCWGNTWGSDCVCTYLPYLSSATYYTIYFMSIWWLWRIILNVLLGHAEWKI